VLRPARGAGERLVRRQQAVGWLLTLPALLLLSVFLFYPVARLLRGSFWDPEFTLENYARAFNAPYVGVLWYTVHTSLTVTAICVILGYPFAYALTRAQGITRMFMLVCLLLPFLTSLMVRTYAWIVILGDRGLLNTWLMNLGLISRPLPLLFSSLAVHIGMVHFLLPFMVLPLVGVMIRIDRNLLQAGQSLGAGPLYVFWKIYLPLSFPGVLTGALLVFILALGFFVTPSQLGGRNDVMLAQLIQQQMLVLGNWGFACALAVWLLVVLGMALGLYSLVSGLSVFRESDE
jgi:putative spermidine/putrescine transport system permease protein